MTALSPFQAAAQSVPAGIIRFPSDDRAAWLKMRERDVTASVAGALLGVHEYVTAYQLWCLKAGLLAEDPEETPPMRRGRLLEPVALQVLREDTGWQVEPCGFYYRDPLSRIGATPDALAIDPARPGFGVIQVKSVEPSIFRKGWIADDGSVEPPTWIVVQAIIEATLSGASWAAVAPLKVSHGLECPAVPVPLHAGIMDRLRSEVTAFWRSIKDEAPPDPDFGRDGAVIAGLYPEDNGREIDLSGSNRLATLLIDHDGLSFQIRANANARDIVHAEIKHMLGPNDAALAPGGRRITWRTQSSGHRFVPPSETRVLRISKSPARQEP